MSGITTHVLDTALGRPAAGVPVRLERVDRSDFGDGKPLASAVTDADGRVRDFGLATLTAGDHRLVFATAAYFAATGQRGFYPEVSITFTVTEPGEHHHVPLLLSPFAYSTYRGS
ncbi:hydroxyisourate hydrolase [Pseudonocardia eucalypti]|uniref:hydroxyisourate hydrolase n=1 Tax=Pseudonocardia eucalypti TaxID=648755 RepID=UPI00161FCBCC